MLHTPPAYNTSIFPTAFGIRSQLLRIVDKPLPLTSLASFVVLCFQEFSRNSKLIVGPPKHHVISYFLILKRCHVEHSPHCAFHMANSVWCPFPLFSLPRPSLSNRWPLYSLGYFWTMSVHILVCNFVIIYLPVCVPCFRPEQQYSRVIKIMEPNPSSASYQRKFKQVICFSLS